ncbi:MAG: type IV secretion system protein [Candidatus Nomurabacteria bacterium]|jgi:hypothetical protein|nr:type IV secretion system protein [Candidatus Nomurabacteria bacterium]
MKRKIITYVLSCISLFGITALFMGMMASADGTSNILKKAALQGLYKCYEMGKIRADIGVLSNYNDYNILIQADGGEDFVPLPNNFQNTINDAAVSCKEVLSGYPDYGSTGNNAFKGLFALAGITPPTGASNASAKDAFLTGMGYQATKDSDGQCVAFYYKLNSSTTAGSYYNESEVYQYTYHLCAPIVNKDGTIGVDKLAVSKEGGSDIVEFEVGSRGKMKLDCELYSPTDGGCEQHTFTKNVTLWDDFTNDVLRDLATHNSTNTTVAGSYSVTYTLQNDIKREPYGVVNATYAFSDPELAARSAIKYLSGGAYHGKNGTAFSPQEEVLLYQTYIEQYYKSKIECGTISNDKLTILQGQGYINARLYVNGSPREDCWVLPTANRDKKVNGLSPARWFTERKTFNDLLDALNSSTANSLPSEDTSSIGNFTTAPDGSISFSGTSTAGTTSSNSAPATTCDIGALGWIICPVITTLDNMLGWFYNTIIQDFMAMPAALFEGDTGTYKAWRTFRDFANIIFVILIMLVIFSQVTSIGISNYGIKKILPRLIVVGVLVNLSYFICQIAVDLSNILGVGLQDLLSGLVAAPECVGECSSQNSGTGLLATVGTALGIGIGGLVVAMAMGFWGIVFALLAFLLSGLVALLMMFVSLSFRKVGIIVLIALAPIAIVCKLLPNTENIYKGWFKMLKTLLVLFPICGLLIGAGTMVGKIIATTNPGGDDMGSITKLVAALCVVLPYFGVFALTKKSLDGLGVLGGTLQNKLNGMQGKMSGAVNDKLRKNNAFLGYQNQQRDIAKTQAKGGVYAGRNPLHKLRNQLSKTGMVAGIRGEDYNRRLRAAGLNAALSDHAGRVKDYATFMEDLNTGSEVYAEMEKAHAAGDRAGVQAGLTELAKRGDFSKIDDFLARDHSGDDDLMQSTISSELIKNKQAAPHHWAYGVDMKKRSETGEAGRSFADFAADTTDDGLREAMAGLGDDALVNMDRDVLKRLNKNGFGNDASGNKIHAGDVFTSKQLRTAATNLTGEKLDALNGMIGQMQNSGAELMNGISAAQLGKTKSDVFKTITNGGDDAKIRSLLSQRGSTLQTAIDDLFKDQNAAMLSEMNPETRAIIEKYRTNTGQNGAAVNITHSAQSAPAPSPVPTPVTPAPTPAPTPPVPSGYTTAQQPNLATAGFVVPNSSAPPPKAPSGDGANGGGGGGNNPKPT